MRKFEHWQDDGSSNIEVAVPIWYRLQMLDGWLAGSLKSGHGATAIRFGRYFGCARNGRFSCPKLG
jgi:hypothetical protein